MNKFKFKPFSNRINNLEITNFYKNKSTGEITPRQSLISDKFDYYEIIKWDKNPFYKTEHLYDESPLGEFYIKRNSPINCKIDKSCFKSYETCYTLASFTNVYNDDSLKLESCGDRPFILDDEEYLNFKYLVNKGFEEILKQLKNYESKS